MKGSPIVSVRIPTELLALVDARLGDHCASRTEFILAAIEEKLSHMARSRKGPSGIPDTYNREKHTFWRWGV